MTTMLCAFHKDMKIQDALLVDPRVKQVLTHFLIGGCHNPFVLPSDSLAHACTQSGAPLDKVLKALNDLQRVPPARRAAAV